MARCFVTRQLPGDALGRLQREHEVVLWEDRTPPSAEMLRLGARDSEGLLSLLTDQVDAELIDACPKLRAISNFAVGTDNIDVAAATARGIPVGNTPGVLTESTADLAVALMLAVSRRLGEGEALGPRGRVADVGAGPAARPRPPRVDGRDRRRGGGSGRRSRARLEGFGMTVSGAGAAARAECALEELLAESDFVIAARAPEP